MNDVTLYLKDGRSHPIGMPGGREFQDILHYMRAPADAANRKVRLHDPAGGALEVPAADIASVEIPPPYALIPDFLTEPELAQVLEFTMSHAGGFQDSGVHEAPNQGGSPYGLRRSRVLDGPANGTLAAMMLPKLQSLLPTLWPKWRMNPMRLETLECQVTAHGEGDFFATHTDNGLPEIAHRKVSYVYYFHREPKQFSGGHLCLYNTAFEGGYGACGRLAADIDPLRNGLMVFPTFIFHEVTPIRCASNALVDQRLTVNGWLF